MRTAGLSGLVLAVLAGTARPATLKIVDDSDPQVDASRAKAMPRTRRRRAFAPALALLAACGGSSSTPPLPDTPPMIDAGCPMQCSPLTQTGCSNTTMKCGWIVDATHPNMGDVACTFAGAVQVNLPCMRDAGGGDPCAKGLTCYQDRCRQICNLTGGAPACGTASTCQSTGYLVRCGETAPIAGLCL
jgi:hypothetical protein